MSADATSPYYAGGLDPTHPAQWERQRQRGKLPFLLTWGVVAVGVPATLLLNVLSRWVRSDVDPYLSVGNALELTFMLLLVAPVLGVFAGHALWGRAKRRAGVPDATPLANDASGAAHIPTAPDREQRRLSALAQQLEMLARTAPAQLTWRIVGMTVLGYGYVLAVALALVGCVIWLAQYEGDMDGPARYAFWMVSWFAFFLLSALHVRMLVPEGKRITSTGSPLLFDALEKIRVRVASPAVDVVQLDAALNASVAEIARFGMFGVPRRFLTVGLPLLEALSREECVAILAHEMAHVSRRHGRRAALVGRLSVTWQSIAISLTVGRHWGRGLLLPFFRWYAPRYDLYAQALSRRDEHESDAMAAECVGPEVTARAMLRMQVTQRFLTEKFLPSVYRESMERPDPPGRVLERMAAALRAGAPRADVERWARTALAERTLDAHTHPSLADRIAHFGVDGRAIVEQVATPPERSGADELLGTQRLPKLRSQVEEAWQMEVLPLWRQLHADARIWRDAERVDGFETSPEALWAHARWAAECEPRASALALVREVLRRTPAHAEAQVTLGRLLSESDSEEERTEGVAALEAAVRRDTMLAAVACAALEAHYQRLGWREEVQRVQTRKRQLDTALLAGTAERRVLNVHDRISAYALPAASLESLRKSCATQADVRRAFLVRKQTRFLREQPCVMLAVECGVPWYRLSDGEAAIATCSTLVERVRLPEIADLLVLPVSPRTRLLRRLRAVPGAMIYERK